MTIEVAETRDATLRLPDPQRDGYHQSWYPIAMSREVAAGEVIAKEFLDGRVVVWRGQDGVAHVHSAFCRHLGADLSLGSVEDNRLRCVFHLWEYGGDGRCTKIPVGDQKPPPQAALFNFPTREQFGLIWAFNGETPLFDLPEFPTVPTDQIVHRVFDIELLPVPPYVILANTHDFQHVAAVHGATMASEPTEFDNQEFTVEFKNEVEDPTLGRSKQHFKLFGLNTLALANQFGPVTLLSMFSCTPVNNGMTKGYTVTGTPRVEGMDPEKILDRGEHFAREIMEDDNAVLKTIRFKPDIPIVADRALMRWLRRAASFPAAHPSKPFIT